MFNFRKVRLATPFLVVAILAGVFAPSASAGCRTYQHRAKVESGAFKTDLAYLYLRERVCYNGRRITRRGKIRIYSTYTKNSIGMSFKGVERKDFRFLRWRGRPRGSWFIFAAGTFEQSFGAGPLSYSTTAHVSVGMRIYGNGDVKKSRKNA